MLYWIFYYFLKLMSFLFFPFSVYGMENFPEKGGCILACNHLSNVDPIVVGLSIKREVNYMAKDTLFENKILAFFLRNGGAFPVKRKSADIGAIREAIKRLKKGIPILIFPQGSRAAVQGRDNVESGIGFLAARSKVPVIPVKIVGSDVVLPPQAKWFKRHPMYVIYGKPIFFTKQDSYEFIAKAIMESIYSIPPGQ